MSFERLSVSGVSAGVEAQVCLERGLSQSQLEGDLLALHSVEATQNKCGNFYRKIEKGLTVSAGGRPPVLHSEESTQNKCGNIESFTALVTIYFIHGSDKASLIWKMTLPEEEKDLLDRIVEKIFW